MKNVSFLIFSFPQVAAIFQACSKPDIKKALFSATLANDVEQWCSLHLDNFVRVLVGIRYAFLPSAILQYN